MRFKKVAKKKEVERTTMPIIETPIIFEPFITTDKKLVDKLQKKFTIKNVSLNRETNVRTFEFLETKDTIEKFLKEG